MTALLFALVGYAIGWIHAEAWARRTRTAPAPATRRPATTTVPPVASGPVTQEVSPETVDRATDRILAEVRARGGSVTVEAARQHALELLLQ